MHGQAMKGRFWACLMIAWAVAGVVPASAAHILIDASKDGGRWWYPQGAGQRFDPAAPHQGKGNADLLRSRGHVVEELPRGATLQPAILRGVDILVRPVPFLRYAPAEVDALTAAVSAGLRLVAMSRADAYSDTPVAAFGIVMGQKPQMGCVAGAADHPMARRLASIQGPWRTLQGAPPPAWIPLAWLGGTTWTQPAVAGYLRHGKGDVVVVGCALESFFRGEALADVVEALASQAPEVLSAALGQAQAIGLLPVGAPQAPTPVSPAEGEELARPRSAQDTWTFTWQPVPGATRYQFAAVGPTATTPAVFGLASTTGYACPVAALPALPQGQHGWVWQVRAQNVATQWSDWSDPRSFSVPGGVPRAAAQRAPPAASPEPSAEPKTAATMPASDTPKARATATLRLGVTIGGLALLVLLGLILIKSMSRP